MRRNGITLMLTLVSIIFGVSNVLADDLRCTGTIGNTSVDNVIVPSGAFCRLNGTLVNGNVFVEQSASLEANGARIGGSIQSEGYRSVLVQADTRVTGSIQLKKGGIATVTNTTVNGDVQFEENAGPSTASFSIIGGSLQAYKNSGRVVFRGNSSVNGNIQTYDNTGGTVINNNRTNANLQVYTSSGGITIIGNNIAQNFQCKDNQSPLTERNNVVGGERGCSSF